MRLLVCGSRDYYDVNRMTELLCRIHEKRPISVLIHGNARGADRMAGEWAKARDIKVEEHTADWSQGKKAGPLRNVRMLIVGKPDSAIAFFGPYYTGSGTEHMVGLLKASGVPVAEIRT